MPGYSRLGHELASAPAPWSRCWAAPTRHTALCACCLCLARQGTVSGWDERAWSKATKDDWNAVRNGCGKRCAIFVPKGRTVWGVALFRLQPASGTGSNDNHWRAAPSRSEVRDFQARTAALLKKAVSTRATSSCNIAHPRCGCLAVA